MARLATTTDVFNAVAEPRRREILQLLVPGERTVNDIARVLCMAQPTASKHLKVLKEVGLVGVREAGQQRLYHLNAQGLKPIHEWTQQFAQFWNESFDRLDQLLVELQKERGTPE